MILRWVLIIVFTGLGLQVSAEETDDYHIYDESKLFIGHMQKTTLYPRDWSINTETCGIFDENGEEYCELIISNGCGHEVIDFMVVKNILRTKKGETLMLKTSIGEWCEYNLELTLEERVIFALKREDIRGVFDNEYTIFAFDLYYDEFWGEYFYLNSPYNFEFCEKLTGVDCYQALKPVDPEYIGTFDEDLDWIRAFKAKGILSKNENNRVYIIKAIFLENLFKLMRLKAVGLR